MYALNLDENNRILSATLPKYAPTDSVIVNALPEGDISEYLYVGGKYKHEPLPEEETVETVSQLDAIEAQVLYTAMMTDTLLEV